MSQSTSVPQAITIAVASARARPHPQSRPPQFIANPTPCPSRVQLCTRPQFIPTAVASARARRQFIANVTPCPSRVPPATRAFSGVRVNVRQSTRPVSHTDYIRRPSTETPLAIPLCPPHNSRQGRSPQNSHLVHLVLCHQEHSHSRPQQGRQPPLQSSWQHRP